MIIHALPSAVLRPKKGLRKKRANLKNKDLAIAKTLLSPEPVSMWEPGNLKLGRLEGDSKGVAGKISAISTPYKKSTYQVLEGSVACFVCCLLQHGKQATDNASESSRHRVRGS